MEKTNWTMKEIRRIIIFIAITFLVVVNIQEIWNGILSGLGIFQPFIIGGAMAFVLNIPMNMFEKRLFSKFKSEKVKKVSRPLSILLSILLVAFIMVFVVIMVIPQLITTITQLGVQIPIFFQELILYLDDVFANNPEILKQLNTIELGQFNWDNIISTGTNFLKSGITSLLSSTMSVASSIFGALTNGLIAFIFSIYVLAKKETLEGQGQKLIKTYLPTKMGRGTLHVLHLLHKNFTNFITGQCLEAVILGCMFVLVMSIAGMPYVILVGVLIAFTALIPLLGAFLGCFLGAFFILVDDPMKALWFVVIFLVLQQVEGNIVYPRVVGSSVGLPSIWVLMAVSVGGSLFGIVGMLSFIPLFSTAYMLIRDDVKHRNQEIISVQEETEEEKIQEAD
ncbi:MAG: AI-2E family transporter [Eubacteriales bacterium]